MLMVQCEILYNGEVGDLRRALKKYMKDNNEKTFLDSFIKGDLPKETRYTKNSLDSTDEVQQSIKKFNEDLETVISALILKSPTSESLLRNLQQLVHSRLHIDLDETQSGSILESDESIETKNSTEVKDLNAANLNNHLLEIYGAGAYDITRTLKERFGDDTSAAGYWDINSGQIVLRNNSILNRNFQNLKNKYYQKIVQYLKRVLPNETQNLRESMIKEGRFIGAEYFDTINKFYKYIKSLDNFQQQLANDQRNRIRQTTRNQKEKIYQEMMQVLDSNLDFHKLISNKYNNKKLSDMLNSLYTADYFSKYYNEAKRLINKLKLQNIQVGNRTVQEVLNYIESDELTLLDATNAYTSLVHFDELLQEIHGKSFSIAQGMEGLEIGDMNKYSYHQDTSHEKKSWQQSESIDSEKYIANLTKQVMSQIRVFDYRTDSYKNRRVDSTAYIVAARNLINDIVYNNITWSGIPVDYNSPRRKAFDNFIKTVIDLHSDPESKFQKTLEYLFDKVDGNSQEFYKNISSKKLLTDYDLDILYSVYNAVYNKQNPYSLISQELKNVRGINGTVQNLVQEMSGYVDRNTTMDYLETSYDMETGQVQIKVKKKFFNNRELYKTRVIINDHVNSVTSKEAIARRDKYNFQTLPSINGSVYYQATIGGETFTLRTPDIGGKILNNSDRVSFENTSLFNRINEIDLVQFGEKLSTNSKLEEDEQLLKEMLTFIDDHLDLKILDNASLGLQILQTYKTIYNPVSNKIVGKNFMMPLMQLAMRAAYANSRYAEANGRPLGQYLESLGNSDDGIYRSFISSPNSKLFSQKYGNVKYTIASFADEVLNLWIDAKSMLTGEASKATTKDKSGNNIPNNSVNKLGTILYHYLRKQEGTNTGSLLFVQNRSLIRSTFHDLEVTTWNNDSKSIRSFSQGELFYHSIFNKFWGNYLTTGNVIIQPTTYSDKTTFINYEINTKLDGQNDILKGDYKNNIIQYYINTIGTMYSNVWNSTKNKLTTIANQYNIENNTTYNYRTVMRNCSEVQLVQLAQRAGVAIMKDKDYRVLGNSTAPNELLEYYANLYSNSDNLSQALNTQKVNFVQNLLDANSSFQVIEFNDEIENYLQDKIPEKATSKNAILNIIKQVYANDVEGRKKFFRDWVDTDTGRLILAKQDKNNIIGIGDNFVDTKSVELNPLLDKFFYLEGLFSNNLRMSLTGSEINHPDKAKGTLYQKVKKTKTIEDLQKLGIKVSKDQFNILQNTLSNTRYVGDIPHTNYPISIAHIMEEIYNDSILMTSNVAQGTQFKRNVIIPATLQYCQQNVRDGIPPKVKCAVIYDEKAHVWNYRGDHEKDIDSADGSAWITPFQSILENKALGSQAVGFTKKPIWHSYDSESGTAFLAKFATDTITNESMRTSLMSHTKLFNLFKKMTNLQWQGDVDLTESIISGKIGNDVSRIGELNKWFQVAILGNAVVQNEEGFDQYLKQNRLIYKNKYGDPIEIIGFDKTVSEGQTLYYTKETAFSKTEISNPTITKVYHVFADITNQDGTVEKSKHFTFDTWQKAKNFINNTPGAHTINSLYELHTALGGIECIDSNGNYSEFSNEVVVNFMNSIGHVKEGFDKRRDIINQETYEQPLKKYQIGYALNNTAVKNGAANINPSTSWYDDKELTYFDVDSDGLGMQMNADHDIIDSELTEFSQVVTATSAYGYTYDQCNEIFKGLAFAALQASKKALDAVDNFIEANFEDKAKAQSDLYDAIGRITFVNQSIKDRESLQNVIMQAVTEIFYKSKDHNQDSTKIPFSDANVYSDFIATLASTINKYSIKRKHPGSGCVIVPGYNIIQYFEINGQKAMASDIIDAARQDYKQELLDILKTAQGYQTDTNTIVQGDNIYYLNNQPTQYLENLINQLKLENTSRYRIEDSDLTYVNKFLIQQYLEKNQASAPTYEDTSWFMPSDIVDIIDAEGNLLTTVDLDNLDTYYKFKDGLYDTELAYNVNIKADYARNKYTITLRDDLNSSFVIEKEQGNIYNIHFKTGGFDPTIQRRTEWASDNPEELEQKKIRLFRASLEALPVGSTLRLAPSTAEQIKTGIGGLTSGSVAGYLSIGTNQNRTEGINIEQTSNTYDVTYTDRNGVQHTTTVAEYKKVGQSPKTNQYRVNVTKPHNLRPSLIRWKYLNDDGKEVYMNIFDTPIIKNSYTSNRPSDYREQIQNTLHNLYDGFFIDRDGIQRTIVQGSLENTAAGPITQTTYPCSFSCFKSSIS